MGNKTRTLVIMITSVCILGIFFAIYTVANSYVQRNLYQKLQNDTLVVQEYTNDLNVGLYHIQTLAMLELMVVDEEKNSISMQIDELNQSNIEILNYLEEHLKESEQQEVLHDLYSNYLNYIDKQKLASSMSQGETNGTMQYYVNNVLGTSLDYMNESTQKLYDMLKATVDEQQKRMEKMTRYALISSIMFSIIVVLVLLRTSNSVFQSSRDIEEQFDSESRSHREQIINMQGKTIKDLAELVESRDGNTGTHIKNTAWYVDKIGYELAKKEKYKDILTASYCDYMTQYAPLHDVGKILVPDAILLKPGKLTPEEFDHIKAHAAQGGEIIERILTGIESEENIKIARAIATYHHEKWDGTGYPFGIAGEAIPICARIMAVADVFDALISPRCYKKAFSIEEAYKIITEGSGQHFDPDIVEVFVTLRPEIEEYLGESLHDMSPEVVYNLIG